MDSRTYPQGSEPIYWRWLNGVLGLYRRSDHTLFYQIDPANLSAGPGLSSGVISSGGASLANAVRNVRGRFTVAEVNAGATALPAIAGFKYRIVDMQLITVGGDASGATSVDIAGTRSAGAVLLLVVPIAFLLRSKVVKPDTELLASPEFTPTVLADGASFTALDSNTAVTIQKAGGTLATATHVDLSLSYVIEAA